MCVAVFEKYGEENDKEWVQCECSRWTHEECADQSDAIIDANDREPFFPTAQFACAALFLNYVANCKPI